MAELLRILADWLTFFFDGNRYRLVHSETTESFGNALIEFSSDVLKWRLVRDRLQIFLECRPLHRKLKSYEWFSTDILFHWITGRRLDSSMLTEEVSKWLGANLEEIEKRLSAERIDQSLLELKELERIRTKEMFG